jgi:D-psicose/D-tagatose/L-ribulose 3-epimerase
MKFGVNTWVWTAPLTTEELEVLTPKIADWGFDHIEIPIDDPKDFDFKKCGEIIRKAGINSISFCAAMGPDRDLIDPDPKVRRNGVEYLKASIDGLALVGGRNMVGPFYSAVGRTWQQSAEEREHDMLILIDILKDLSECRVGSRLIQVHSNENNRGTPGAGHVPWKEIAQALKDIKFDGVLVIESFTSKVKSIARAAAIWRPLAVSQDALAADGVMFLRELLK